MTSIETIDIESQEHLCPRRLGFLYSGGMKIAEWVRLARKHIGWTQEQLGAALNLTKGNISAWENDRHDPSFDQIMQISRLTGFAISASPDISMTGLSVQEPEPPYGHAAQPPMSPILAWEHPDDLPEGEFVMIPRLDVTLSAGPGREQHVDVGFTKSVPQAFRADWIRAERLKPAKLAAMTAKGESMEPAIFDGDSLLIDTSQTEVQDGRVYALWYEGGERVKRLYRLPGGGLRIQSDNPKHLSIDIPPTQTDAVRIIGRVVIRSGRGGL